MLKIERFPHQFEQARRTSFRRNGNISTSGLRHEVYCFLITNCLDLGSCGNLPNNFQLSANNFLADFPGTVVRDGGIQIFNMKFTHSEGLSKKFNLVNNIDCGPRSPFLIVGGRYYTETTGVRATARGEKR